MQKRDRWWPGQLPVMTLSALHARGPPTACHKIARCVFSFLVWTLLKFETVQLPSLVAATTFRGSSQERASRLAIFSDPSSAPIWPVAIIICPPPSFPHSVILKYFACFSSIWVGTILKQICVGLGKCHYKCTTCWGCPDYSHLVDGHSS